MSALKLGRRTVIRGLLQGAAVSVGLPPLEAMFNANGTAHADGSALPRRLGIFFFGNGVRIKFWTPATAGANWTPSPSLMPLSGVKDYVNVVSGTNLMIPKGQGHHTGSVGILSGAPYSPSPFAGHSTFTKPSIDQVAATEIMKANPKLPFKSLEVGVCHNVKFSEGTTLGYLSHNGPDSPNPPIYDPAELFKRVFGGNTVPAAMSSGTPAAPDPRLALRKSVLDAVAADIDAMKGRVSAFDRLRLDQHLTGIRGIENRLQNVPAAVGAACKTPTAPMSYPAMPAHEPIEEVTTAMSKLLAVAMACDQTRVFSMMFSGSVGMHVFWPVNVLAGHHNLTHDEGGDQPQVQSTTVYTMQMFSVLLQAFKDTPEGAGNLLDNSAILCSSDTTEGRAHNVDNYPILIGGKGGGFLKYPGIHYQSTTGENSSLALMSVLRASGVNVPSVGGDSGMVTSSLGGIEA